jgi:uncharacterized protein (TIGR00251 family)
MLLHIKVKPNQRFNSITKIGDEWIVKIKARPVDGEANEYLVKYIAEKLNIAKSKVVLKKGQTSKVKCLEIEMEEKVVYEMLNNWASTSSAPVL